MDVIYIPKGFPIEVISDPEISWGIGIQKGDTSYGICGQGSSSAQQLHLEQLTGGSVKIEQLEWEEI